MDHQNRDLQQVHFNGDDFEFKNPFWYSKKHFDRPLCPHCFACEIVAPMSEPHMHSGVVTRYCLTCNNRLRV